MAGVRSMLARVARLEQARTAPRSPFESAFGSFEAFETDVWAGMNAGVLDIRDMTIILHCLRGWHRDTGMWQRNR